MDRQTLSREITQLHANICSALADPSRILLLYVLSEGPSNVSGLTENLGLPQPTVSRHLKVLRERGLVKPRREGQTVIYELTDPRVIEALDLLRAVLADRLASRAALANEVGANLRQ